MYRLQWAPSLGLEHIARIMLLQSCLSPGLKGLNFQKTAGGKQVLQVDFCPKHKTKQSCFTPWLPMLYPLGKKGKWRRVIVSFLSLLLIYSSEEEDGGLYKQAEDIIWLQQLIVRTFCWFVGLWLTL